MSSKQVNTKTIARIAAIQTLYQYHLSGYELNVDALIQEMIKHYQNGELHDDFELTATDSIKVKLSISYFTSLVQYTIEHLEQLDEIILTNLDKKGGLDALSILLFAILRTGICELKFFPETPKKVVVNEFTDITNDMLSGNEVSFVNSILDKISKGQENVIH
jgi:N utilization substance protein B